MAAALFCNACGGPFEADDRYCARCGAGRFDRLDPTSMAVVSPEQSPPSAQELFPGYVPVPWSMSGAILTNTTGQLAIYAVSKADAEQALWDLRLRKRSLSSDEHDRSLGVIETAMQRLGEVLRASEQGQP